MDHAPPATAIETNLSWVFLTPTRVYKQLKPIELPFVDHRDVATRCAAATQEFEVNRAISPTVYLSLAEVHDANNNLAERLIVMRRLRDEYLLTAPRTRSDLLDALERVARRIAGIHLSTASHIGNAAEPAGPAQLLENWEDNFLALAPHRGTVIPAGDYDEVMQRARAYLAGRSRLFSDREQQGWVRSGHGDLRCEHVYIEPEQVQLIDALAFNETYRVCDVLNDIAFLAMDVDRIFGPEWSLALMRSWGEYTNEHHPSTLAHFFVAYRAHVRAKVACIAHEAGVEGAAEEMRRYHDIAVRHLHHAQPRVTLVGGGPGTGKSTVAEALANRTGAIWIRADEVRKDLAGMGHDDHAFAAPGEGIYSSEMSDKVHAEIARQTAVLLAHGESVVLDATWGASDRRDFVRSIATKTHAEITEIRCVAPAGICKERIARRMASIYNPSDATPETVDYLNASFEDWPEAGVLDTTKPVASNLQAAVNFVLHREQHRTQTDPEVVVTATATRRYQRAARTRVGPAASSTEPRSREDNFYTSIGPIGKRIDRATDQTVIGCIIPI